MNIVAGAKGEKKMPRYIDIDGYEELFDAEYKETKKLIEQGETHLDILAEGFYEASQVIDRIPVADVVKVVRCKDCKHLMKDIVTEETPYGFDEDRYVFGCRKFFESSGEWVDVMLDDYCSSGERGKGNG